MSDPEKRPDALPDGPEQAPQQPEKEPYVPASPFKRIIAWMAVVYMGMIVLLNLYPFFNQGAHLFGVFPLFICPAGVGLVALAVCRLKQGVPGGGKVLMGILAAAGAVLCVKGLVDGLPFLIAGL